MATQGPNLPSTGADVSGTGTVTWNVTSNITAEDAATVGANLTIGASTHWLKATGFGFSIPSGATINGITVEWKVSIVNATSRHAQDIAARIVKAGTIGTTDRANATTYTTTLTWLSHGGASDLWGDSWSDTDINGSTFGAALSVIATQGSPSPAIDACRITIDYTAAGAAGQPTVKRQGGVGFMSHGGYQPGTGRMQWRQSQQGLILPQPENGIVQWLK